MKAGFHADAASQQLTPVPGLASTTAAGLARRVTPARWRAVESGLAAVTGRMLGLLPAPRVTALTDGPVTIGLDTIDVEVCGRKKRGVACNRQGQRAGRPHVAAWAEAEIVLAAGLGDGTDDPRATAPDLLRRALAALPAAARAGRAGLRAFGLSFTQSAPNPVPVTVTGPDTGFVQTSLTETISPPCQTFVNALVGGTGTTITDIQACAEVVTTGGAQLTSKSTAGASIKALTVDIPGVPEVRAETVISGSQTTCSGSTGATCIGYLSIGSDVLISQPQLVAPNTHLTVGQISVNLNEQTPFTLPADRGLLVDAIQVSVGPPSSVTAHLIAGSTEGLPGTDAHILRPASRKCRGEQLLRSRSPRHRGVAYPVAARSWLSHSVPSWRPSGSWSPRSQRHDVIIASTRIRHSRSRS